MRTLLHHVARPPQGPGHYSADGRRWYDEAGSRWLRVLDEDDSLTIELEDVNARGWWAGLLATLASPTGGTYSWFVARATSADPRWPEYTFTSATFHRLRSVPDTMPPEEAWAPGMTDALEELRSRLEAEGWRLVGRGKNPWSYSYVRPRVEWPAD